MAGFLKRLFKFGKKNNEEESAEPALEEADSGSAPSQPSEADSAEISTADAEEQAAAEALAEQEAAEEARKAQEAKEARDAEAAAAKKAEEERAAAAAKLKAEQEAAEQLRVEREAAEAEVVEAERVAQVALADEQAAIAKEEAKAKAKEEAENAKAQALEAERLAQEELAKQEADRLKAEAEAQRLADEQEAIHQAKLAEEAAEAERLAQIAQQEEQAQQDAEAQARAAAAEETATEEIDGIVEAPPETHVEAAEAAPEPLSETPESMPDAGEEQPSKKSWFNRLKDGLTRSSSALTENITAVFTKRKLDEDTLQELEDILVQADLGIETAMNVTEKLASQRMGKDVTDEEVRGLMADEIETVLNPVAQELELDLDMTPHVILVVGVNGSGKTTTIGKLSQKLYDAGFSTLLVAGDTFRAAAIEQLKIWGDRTQSPVVSRPLGSDAAGLAFDAYELAVAENRDVMLMDTAGRLQNKKELMDELEKIIRVLKKRDPTAPHTVLLTLDATTGQNALNQVEIFKDVAGVNGLVMTKLDGTARGGILVSISAKHKLPVYFLGVGEGVEDLEPFEARDFARTLAGIDV